MWQCDLDGMRGAQLRHLLGNGNVPGDLGPHRVCPVANNDDGATGVQRFGGPERVHHERPTTEQVQRLRQLRAHARPRPRRQHNDGD
jgi:hypothetical protein